jgi:hypothetical protein
MVHTEILIACGHEIPGGRSLDEFYASVPHLKCQDISDAIIYVLGTPPHVQVWQLNSNTFLFVVCAYTKTYCQPQSSDENAFNI